MRLPANFVATLRRASDQARDAFAAKTGIYDFFAAFLGGSIAQNFFASSGVCAFR